MKKKFLFIVSILITAFNSFAQETKDIQAVDSGDTSWLLISSALIMMMTAPALAFFYGGLVKRKNILNILMQCFVALSVISILWITIGYTLSFSPKELIPGFIGNFDWAFLNKVDMNPSSIYGKTVPHLAFMIFQGMFAVITPALIIGAFAERMKFSSYIVFIIAWTILVYFPVTHWIWSANGWLNKLGVLDFAGGIVVHVNAGIAALVTAIVIGKRNNLKSTNPHNLPFTMLGAALLWFGWFGFNAGSALISGGLAANAFVVTNSAAAIAVIVWALLDWIIVKKPTMLGSATGAIAGLAAITPAAGYVDIKGALIIGAVSSLLCYFMVVLIKPKFGYDDALDAFGVHGVGGIIGSLFVGLFATSTIQAGYNGLFFGNPKQFLLQLLGVGVTLVYSLILTFVIIKLIDITMGLRIKNKDELVGLDVTQHNERGYTLIE